MVAPDSMEVLLPQANQLMTALKDGLKDLAHSLGECRPSQLYMYVYILYIYCIIML